MGPGGGDLEGALGVLLAPDVGEIEIRLNSPGEHLRVVEVVGRHAHAAFEYLHCLAQGADAVDQGAAGESSLAGVLPGHDHAVDLRVDVGGHGECTGDRAQTGVEREFSQQHEVAQAGSIDLAGSHEDARRDRQVEGGSHLANTGRGEVHGDAPPRPLETCIADRRHDALPAFAHRAVRQADHTEGRKVTVGVDLDVDEIGVDTEGGGAQDGGRHEDRAANHMPAEPPGSRSRVSPAVFP